MCEYWNWYADEDGYIIQCKTCLYFQVCFGTTMVTLTEKQYHGFIKVIAAKKHGCIALENKNCKHIIIPTISDAINIILSERELDHLYDMTQTVDNELKTNQLLSLFKN